MSNDLRSNLVWKVFLLTALLGIVSSGCNLRLAEVPRLRITNNGSVPINNLVVLFPEENIEFGNISPGTTTEYKDVPKGVFSYAAYQFEVDGEVITQPVIDWVGESPMNGTLFTYVIDFDPDGARMQVIEVRKDD
jgi:hypothetical protein